MERNQFTCYRSFYEAISRLEGEERLAAYDSLMQYALDGVEPDVDALPGAVAIAFLLMKPTLQTSKRKAENRLGKTKNKGKTNEEQTNNKGENKKESKSESKSECKNESECKSKEEKESFSSDNPLTPFVQFWQAYPRKEGRAEAERVFAGVKAPLSVLLGALQAQKQQPQWLKEGGRYIPSPAKWLSQRRWEDVPPPSHPLGDAEVQAMRRMMEQGLP